MHSQRTQQMPFKKDDIIIKTGAIYPHGALVVDGYDDQNHLLAHPQGGGLQYAFIPSAQQQFRLVSPDEQKETLWRSARFSLEGVEGAFEGWANGQLWNGWEMPHFQFNEAQKLVDALNDSKIRYDPATNAFVSLNGDGEDEVWPARPITTLGSKQLQVYPIGAGSWCWEEVPNE